MWIILTSSNRLIELVHKGKKYYRRDSKWFDSDNMVACLSMQQELNRVYSTSIDLSTMSIVEVQNEADRYKESGSYNLALRYYEYVLSRCDRKTTEYVLPRITSCYRHQGRARDAIQAFSNAKRKYGTSIFNSALLTSVAAAYCDLGEYDNAKKCCDIALKKSGGSEELKNVYKRIKKETSA